MAASAYFDQVQKLYIAYFGRPADPTGLNFWAANIDAAGGNLNGVIAGFSASTESQVLYASATTSQLVTSIYVALFNRPPEAAGLAYWVQQIDTGTLSGARAAYEILSSAGPGDATAIANKVSAATAFTNLIDTQAELSGYVGTTAANYGRAYLAGVDATSVSLANATASSTLNNTVAVATNTNTSNPGGGTPAGQTFTLTAGADTVQGGDGNDNIVATLTGAFGKGDSINGGGGTDTLTVTDTASINSSGVTVSNVETASITSSNALTLDTTTWSGLKTLTAQAGANATVTAAATTDLTLVNKSLGAGSLTVNGGNNVTVTASGSTTGVITIGGTTKAVGEVNVSNTVSAATTMGTIAIGGGTKVNVTQTASNAVNTTATVGTVTINGSALTTAVSVDNTARAVASVSVAGVNNNSVAIIDVNAGSSTLAGTITDISVKNYTVLGFAGTGLKNLSLSGGSGNMVIDNSGLTVNNNRTLNLSVNGLTGGTLDDADIYNTLNVTTTGQNSTMANITFGALNTLNVAGSQVLTLTSTAGSTALSTVTVTGAAGLTANLATSGSVTKVDASATSGNMTVSIDATKASYLGGSGVDKVTLTNSAAPTKTVTGGTGSSDVLSLTAASAASLSNPALISGFEQVTFTSATNQTVDTSMFGGATSFSTSAGNGLTLNGLVSGSTLILSGSGTAYTLAGSGFSVGLNDTLNLRLTDGSGAGVAFASTGITAANVENLAITTVDSRGTPTGTFNDSLSVLGNSVKTISVSGNAGLTLTANSTALGSVDASGITLGGFTWTAGSITAALTVKGSATGLNTVNLTQATGVTSYSGGSGNDTLTVGAITQAVNINVGSGTDRVNLNGVQTTKLGFATLTGMGTGDIVSFAGATAGSANTAQTTLGAQLTGQSTLDGYLDLAAAGNGATNTVLSWFQLGGDTYIVQDASASAIFNVGTDSVVKISGLVDLSASTISSNVVTL